jgi:hypothetical protein
MMKITYDKVKNDIWEVIKDRQDFVYERVADCDACTDHQDWEYDEELFDEEPPPCTSHFDIDACRYFYANPDGSSNCNTPACVVGNWFVFEGFSPEDLSADTWDELEGRGIRQILEQSRLEMDNITISFLNNIQENQDTGLSWGDAFDRAVVQAEGQSDE